LRATKKVCKEEEKLAKIKGKNLYNLSIRIEDSGLYLFVIFLFSFLFSFILFFGLEKKGISIMLYITVTNIMH